MLTIRSSKSPDTSVDKFTVWSLDYAQKKTNLSELTDARLRKLDATVRSTSAWGAQNPPLMIHSLLFTGAKVGGRAGE